MKVSPVSEVTKVVVVGASGFGRESLDVLEAMIEADSPIEIFGVVDDFPTTENLERLESRGVAYQGTIDNFIEHTDVNVKYILGIGKPAVRETLVSKIESVGFTPFTAVHPTAVIGTRVICSPGVVVCAGAVISTNVRLGRHVHVNPNATIGHDSVLEDFVSVNPAAVISGEILIKQNSLIGAASTILQGLVIGENSIVGACSCVTKNVLSGQIVKGVPAR